MSKRQDQNSLYKEENKNGTIIKVAIILVIVVAVLLTALMIVLLKDVDFLGKEEKGSGGKTKTCDHEWKEATCYEPRTCYECGETRGQALAHSWKEATCAAPRTCINCGEMQGQTLAHTWQEATCAAPKTCIDCGQTEGQSLPHTWKKATFAAPKTCTVCGGTEGSHQPYEHLNTENEIEDIRNIYYDIKDMEKAKIITREEIRHGVYVYTDDYGTIHRVVVSKGKNSLGEYSDQYYRNYYLSNGKLVFAFFEGKDSHRLYFYDGQLMHWTYRSVETDSKTSQHETFTFSDEYMHMEELALAELEAVGILTR